VLTVRFINGELPWTPQSFFDAMISYFQGL